MQRLSEAQIQQRQVSQLKGSLNMMDQQLQERVQVLSSKVQELERQSFALQGVPFASVDPTQAILQSQLAQPMAQPSMSADSLLMDKMLHR